MLDLYAALGQGHQIANLVTVAAMVGGFTALLAWGAATEKRATPEAVKAPAGPAKPLAAVDIPQFLRERNAA